MFEVVSVVSGTAGESADSMNENRRKKIYEKEGWVSMSRALRNHSLWLLLTYVGLILLMARTYA